MIKVGDEIEPRTFMIDRALLKKYADASGDQNPIHQDEDFAKSVGLPDVIAHGMLSMALAGKFVSDWAGGPAHVKEFSTRFVKPVIVPKDRSVDLTVSATVAEVEGDQVRLNVTATSEGIKVLGMTKALVQKS